MQREKLLVFLMVNVLTVILGLVGVIDIGLVILEIFLSAVLLLFVTLYGWYRSYEAHLRDYARRVVQQDMNHLELFEDQ